MAMDTWGGRVLEGEDVNEIMSVVSNLGAEVAELRRRVQALEQGDAPSGDSAELQDQIDELVSRVFSPLTAESPSNHG